MPDQGKCIDFEIKSKVCKSCQYWKSKKGTEKYLKLKDTHVCTVNHDGSAGKMECEGVKAIYHRSVEKHSLRYTTYLGDADIPNHIKNSLSRNHMEIKLNVLAMSKKELGHGNVI